MTVNQKTIITCALTGVLTDPAIHPVPVTPEQMAREARLAYDAGASIMHVHFRCQDKGKGHLPTWDPDIAADITDAIRSACPGVIINMSTGTLGPEIEHIITCLKRIKPEIAACNAGSLNYLKTRRDGSWAWPPLLFDNPVEKINTMLEAMAEINTVPEFECFDVGIVRSVGLFVENGMASDPEYNFVCGVASGMPTDPALLPLLIKYHLPDCPWQVTAIGREEVWNMHQLVAELGGNLRTGLEDCFYLSDGKKARNNGELIDALANVAIRAGRDIASPEEAREIVLTL